MILKIENLTKKYGSITAVSDLSLSIESGCIYGILGPNGSGKTTTLGIALGVINSTTGKYAWFNGDNSSEHRKRIGAILETPNFYHYLSAYKNLEIVAEIKGIKHDEIDKALEKVNLLSRKDSRFSTFSLGMKQRLSIASALMGDPEVLVLDEPTNGLDPQGIAEIRELIIRVAKEGKTIILASHLLDEVEKVCTHVAVIQKGKLLAAGNVTDILAGDDIIEVAADNMQKLEELAGTYPQLKSLRKNNAGKIEIITKEPVSTADINSYFHKQGITLSHLMHRKKSLEARFLELTQKN
jgi:ABC-2 type transport system ATP-binding protein